MFSEPATFLGFFPQHFELVAGNDFLIQIPTSFSFQEKQNMENNQLYNQLSTQRNFESRINILKQNLFSLIHL